jgi:hypothetical protein
VYLHDAVNRMRNLYANNCNMGTCAHKNEHTNACTAAASLCGFAIEVNYSIFINDKYDRYSHSQKHRQTNKPVDEYHQCHQLMVVVLEQLVMMPLDFEWHHVPTLSNFIMSSNRSFGI